MDVTRSFIVQAPAGSGKTTLLVERFLKLLEITPKPEAVLAITFTKKAAAEMRKRVLEKLHEGPAHGPAPREIAHRLRIETIDAFCMSLARQLPVPAQFGVPPGIVEDAHELYREAAANTLALLETKDYGDKVATLLSHLDNNVATATSLISSMLARRDQWLRKTGGAPTRAELELALSSERHRLLQKAKDIDGRASEEFARDVLTLKDTFNKKKPHAKALEGNEPLRLALAQLKVLPPEKYSDEQWAALEAMLALLPVAAAQLKLVFAAAGEADFTEIAQGAVRALGSVEDPSDLLLELDAKISHILVDEFQDTSISQWELLERLTAGWQADDGRTLFVVGDPMQSIYRFREAEVALFLKARREGLPNVKLEPIALKTNFRSQANLVDWFNASFSSILPAEENETSGAVPYSAAASHHPALPGAAARWHCFADPASEAQEVVKIVAAAKGTKALLVRNRTALAAIVPALKAAGLRFRAIEIEHLGEKQVVQDLFALTRALTHLADRVAWLAILRAPWVGLSLADLSSFFENKKETVWETVQAIPSLERFRAVIGPALANRQRGSLRGRVEAAWLALGGPACLEDPADLEDAGVFLDELEMLEEAGEVDFARLAGSLDELYAQPDPVAGEADLQIMTIHKAKGLEFDTVIVPGLDRLPGRTDTPLIRWKELVPKALLLAPIKETGADEEPAYKYLADLDREAEDTEAARLLYVAATRAIERLHLMACAKTDDHGAVKPPTKRSLLARAWAVAREHFPEKLDQAPDVEPSNRELPPQTLRRLPAAFKLPPPPAPAAWSSTTVSIDESPEFSWAGETARHVGTVVHRWLQRIAEDELKGWDAKRIDSLKSRFEMELKRRGVQDVAPAAELVSTALKNTLADERGRWLLGRHHEAKNEYRIRTKMGSHVIDRLVRESDGTLWIIDYKTSRHEGANVGAFLDQERARYARRMRMYGDALSANQFALYFPLIAREIAWRD
ncbi:MAG: UvrD-helicase domain-containing protein [Burkholderiales bacterium]